MQKRRWVFDLEASGLLDHTSIDYLSVPFKLKDTFRVWCAVFIDEVTGATVRLRPHELDKIKSLLACAESLTGHNIISYDLMVLKLYFGIDFFINEYDYKKCWVGGHTMEVVDTLILSQYLQPDRLGGHSLKAWGIRLGVLKGTYGEENEEAWAEYSEEMLDYCEQDVKVNVVIAEALWKEWGDWDHAKAFSMEQAINEIVVRQEHIGFHFDREKAQAALDDLNDKLAAIEREVEPLLPKVKLAKTNAAKYALPARQVKQDGTLTKHMENWIANHNAECEQDEYGDWIVKAYGQTLVLPYASTEPLVTHAPMQLSDQKQMKQYLVHLGWIPTVWNSRDLTLKSGTKIKVGLGKYKEAVLRYCQDTAKSHFKGYRLAEHRVKSVQDLYTKLMEANIQRPVYVLTSPKYTIDQEKTICPNLLRLGKQVEWVEKVVLWLTYRHRRNMLLSPNGTGLMAHPRLDIDSRIPTGAIVTGTNTYRFKHRGCVNIPRPSSIYGAEIRELFGCGEGFYQIGCDAASLEGRVQGHYCYPYTDGVALAKTLIAEKPNDIHTVRAKSLGISRDDAKAIGYACLPEDSTEVLTKDGWKFYGDLAVGDMVASYNRDNHTTEWKPIIFKHKYEGAEVHYAKHSHGFSVECTPNHRWFTTRRTGRKVRYFVDEVVELKDLTTEHSIITSAPIVQEGMSITKEEAAVIGWLAADGHFSWSKDTRKTSSSFGAKRGVGAGITQAKHKFYREIQELLDKVGIEYRIYQYGDKAATFGFMSDSARKFLRKVLGGDFNKHDVDWVKFVLSLSPECLQSFARAFYLAEGNTNGVDDFYEAKTKILSQNEGNLLDALQIVGQLLGWRTIVSTGYKGSGSICKDIKWTAKNHVTMQRVEVGYSRHTTVFCLEVADNNSFIIRQGNTVTITANCLYGAQVAKLQSMLGCTKQEAERVFKEFWESTPALHELKARVEMYWEKNGKTYLKGIDGRKVNTRSKHSLLNALFQSAGIILMKWAAIILDRKLEKDGLLFKPFDSDTWEGKCAQMQHYHDEYQFKVDKALVEVGDNNVLTSPVSRYLEEAIGEAGVHLNMRVAFAGEAMIGTNWRECH